MTITRPLLSFALAVLAEIAGARPGGRLRRSHVVAGPDALGFAIRGGGLGGVHEDDGDPRPCLTFGSLRGTTRTRA